MLSENTFLMKDKKKTTTFVIVFFLMAESVGFEPTIERSPYT